MDFLSTWLYTTLCFGITVLNRKENKVPVHNLVDLLIQHMKISQTKEIYLKTRPDHLHWFNW